MNRLMSMLQCLFGCKPPPVPPAPEVYTPPPSIAWHRKGTNTGRFIYHASATASDLVLAAPVVVRYEWTDTRRGWCAYAGGNFVCACQTAKGAMLQANPHAVGLLTRRGPDILDILARNAAASVLPPVEQATPVEATVHADAASVPDVLPAVPPGAAGQS